MKGCIKPTPGQRVLAAENRVSMMEEQQEASVAGTESVRGEKGRQVREVNRWVVNWWGLVIMVMTMAFPWSEAVLLTGFGQRYVRV